MLEEMKLKLFFAQNMENVLLFNIEIWYNN